MLEGRRIVLGVAGGIAAYKAVEVCRRLVDGGAHVVPVLTRGALRFVGETTFSALASERVRTSLFDDPDPIPHTRLGQSADLVLVAPATARVIGAYAAGISNDLLTATLLATEAPVVVCPAMHAEMWRHPAVQDNIATLRRRGVHVVEPEEGRLAGGDVGQGRLAEPATIVAAVESVLARGRDMAGLHVLVTAGGTREPIDPVRFIGNRSSGLQGYALARTAVARGARVTLVSANVALPDPAGARIVPVGSAEEMHKAVLAAAGDADAVVMAAAVADFRPASTADRKIKTHDASGARQETPAIDLVPNPDILAGLVRRRRDGQVIVGFAAETGADAAEVLAHGRDKARRKGADLLAVNHVGTDRGFGDVPNAVVILRPEGTEVGRAEGSKSEVAAGLLDAVEDLIAMRT